MKVFGEAVIAGFAQKHPPPVNFATVCDYRPHALCPYFPAVKETFPTTDDARATGTLIFNIGGNKYRLIGRIDFEEELLAIQTV